MSNKDSVLPDSATEFGAEVARQLREAVVVWLTTVDADGTPQPNPVWFLWDGESFLIYSRHNAKRNAHVAAHSRVSLNFDSVDHGESVVIITGEARIVEGAPLAHEVPEYVAKYRERVAQITENKQFDAFAKVYPVAIRVTPTRVRGF